MPLLVIVPFFILLFFFVFLFILRFLSTNKLKRELLLNWIIFILPNENENFTCW